MKFSGQKKAQSVFFLAAAVGVIVVALSLYSQEIKPVSNLGGRFSGASGWCECPISQNLISPSGTPVFEGVISGCTEDFPTCGICQVSSTWVVTTINGEEITSGGITTRACIPHFTSPVCGNGVLEQGEQCESDADCRAHGAGWENTFCGQQCYCYSSIDEENR